MRTKTLKQTVTFKASPRQVYDMIMVSKKHQSLSGEKAKISQRVGGKFTAWGSHLSGINLVLKPGKKSFKRGERRAGGQITTRSQFSTSRRSIEISPATMVRGFDEIEATFAVMKQNGADAVVVQGSLSTKNVAELALKHSLPAAAISRSFAEVGGLMSYGHDEPDSFRRAAVFVAKVLQGGKPADMPVEQPTKFELVINVKTAKALGLTIPESFLLRADKVIE